MPSTFWLASSVTVNNTLNYITVQTGDDISSIYENSFLKVSNYSEPVEVKRAYMNAAVPTIELFANWPGANASGVSAVVVPSAAAVAAAAVDVQALVTLYTALGDSVSSVATADSLVKRTSTGRIKAVTSSASDDVVVKSELGTAATKDVTTSTTDTTANRLLKVGDFGIGSNLSPQITDFTVALAAGHYRALLSTTTGGPDTVAYNVSVTVENAVSGTGQTFIVKRVSSVATAGAIWYGYRNGSTGAITWNELYHSGNSVNPLDFGIGLGSTGIAPSVSNLDTNKASGLFKSNGGETGAPVSTSIGSVINLKRGTTDAVNQIFMRGNQADGQNQMFIRGGLASTFSPWSEVYHSGNTNFDTWKSVSIGDILCTGIAVSSTTLRFSIDTDFSLNPAGITVLSGKTFSINATNGDALAAGITTLGFNGRSTPKQLVFDVTTSGLTTGNTYQFRSEQADSQFKATF